MNIFKIFYRKMRFRSYSDIIKYYRKLGVKIGNGSIILSNESSFGSEPYLISIGENCLISGNVQFLTHDGGMWVLNNLGLEKKADKFGKIKIGNNVFIGIGAVIMPGITIGDNCIIGAGSIVTKNIYSNRVVAGVPAKEICTIEEYHLKNKSKIVETYGMSYEDKKNWLLNDYKNK